jgi:hypothetical protein
MTRLKAAGIHVLISFFIVATVLATMYLLWYPNKYFLLMGGQKLIVLLASVDIFLGPLLTFIVFKSGKKSLKFDLFCIGLVQIAALSYGVYVMFESRPVFTVFNKDKFQISAVVDIAPEELAKANNPQWRQFSITGPELVAIGVPDVKDRNETMFAKVESANAYRYPRLYDQYKNHRDDVIKSGKPLTRLAEVSAKNKAAIDKFINSSNRPENDFLYLPISSELAEMSVIIDAKTGDFIQIIDATSATSIE